RPMARNALRQVVSELVRENAMVPLSAVFAAFKKQAQGQALPPPISTVGFVTCDRPELLERALASYARNAREFERRVRFVVLDDSRDPSVRKEYRRRLKALGERDRISIAYAGREEKERYA